jgi:hypothetical protein
MQSTYKCIAIVSLLTVVAGVATAAETSAPPDSQLIAALKAKLAEEAAADSFSGRCCQPKTETRALLGRMGLADRERKTANTLEILCRERMDPASPQAGMSTANTRIGAGFLSLAVARSVSRRRVRFEGAVGDFLGFVQIAMRQVRSGRAARRRYGLGMGRVK